MSNISDYFHKLLVKSPNIDDIRGGNVRYLKWNLSLFPIEKKKKLLELGSGPGMYFYEFMSYLPSLYVATDCDSNHIEKTKALFNGYPYCEAYQIDLTDPGMVGLLEKYNFDYAVCFDVLEHIKDDRRALQNIHEIMKHCKISYLFLRVPALRSIYGSNDKNLGHYRRYSIHSLRELLEDCSFSIKSIHYQNLLGIFPWIIKGMMLRRTCPVSVLEWGSFDYIVPVIRKIEQYISLPFGLTINCICSIKQGKR